MQCYSSEKIEKSLEILRKQKNLVKNMLDNVAFSSRERSVLISHLAMYNRRIEILTNYIR